LTDARDQTLAAIFEEMNDGLFLVDESEEKARVSTLLKQAQADADNQRLGLLQVATLSAHFKEIIKDYQITLAEAEALERTHTDLIAKGKNTSE